MDTSPFDNHAQLLVSAQGSKLRQNQIDDLAGLDALSPVISGQHAFTRISTVADFHDALFLFLSGYNVSYEPVAGGLGGFASPTLPTITRRVSTAPVAFKQPAKWKHWIITLDDDSPASIAGAVQKLLTHKNRAPELLVDLTKLPAGPRAEAIANAFTGAVNLLNWRAARTLSVCDIADLFEWFSELSPADLDGMIAYGTREWGPFVTRSITDHLEQRAKPDVTHRANRTVNCFVQPVADDLQKLVAWSRTAKKPFGLINGRLYGPTGSWPAGMSPDKDFTLGDRTVIHVVSGDMSGSDTIEEARRRAKLLARAAYRETLGALPSGLQSAWTEQKDLHRLSAIGFRWLLEDHSIQDLTNHADNAAYQQADELKRLRCERVQVAKGSQEMPIDAALSLDWNRFVAANFRP